MTDPNPTQPLRILGIDPGLADVGWGVIDHEPRSGKSRLVGYGVVRTPAGAPLAGRLETIFEAIAALIEDHRPAAVSIEELFFAKNAKTAMIVAHGRAACILATARRKVPLHEFTPLQIKQALTGSGRAGKAQVQQMVKVVLALPDIPKPDHAADALAAALCHAHALALGAKLARARGALADAGLVGSSQGGVGERALRGRAALDAAVAAAGKQAANNPMKALLAQMRTGKRSRRR